MCIWLPNGQELMKIQQELTTLYLVFFLQFFKDIFHRIKYKLTQKKLPLPKLWQEELEI
jgi:hypothetical protein